MPVRVWVAGLVALLAVGAACTSGDAADPSPSPTPSPSRPPEEVAAEVVELLAGEISGQTGVETAVECPPEAAAGGSYECVARPVEGGERRVFVEATDATQLSFRVGINARRLEETLAGEIGAQLGVPVTLGCPDDVVSESAAAFTCTATGEGGMTAQVAVTQTDDAGGLSFEVTPDPPPPPDPAAPPPPASPPPPG